jgi:6-phosphofructokinase 1
MELDERCVRGVSGRGGTILGTSRNGDLKCQMLSADRERMFAAIGIDSLVVLGGGGSIGAADELARAGWPLVAVPCTIDNDVAGTDYTVGSDTALNHIVRAANDIADTGESLAGRVFLIETLGGDTGHIAVASAYAIGADAVIVPEIEPDLPGICSRIKAHMDAGKPYAIIVAAEGAHFGQEQSLVETIADSTGRRIRPTVLGHAQRGGAPTHWDRTIARRFGELAVDLLAGGEFGVMTALQAGDIRPVDLSIAASEKKPFDVITYNLVNLKADR